MASRTLELWALAERLQRLEKQNRRVKYAGAAVLLLVFAAVLMGQAWPPSETIEARAFIVRDADGVERARLATVEEGPALILYDADGRDRVMLAAVEAGPSLVLPDAQGNDRATLIAVETGPGLYLHDADGELRAVLGAAEAGPGFALLDSYGKVLFSAP